MPVYTDKKTGRLYIEFQYKGERVKERLPEGTKNSDAEAIEIRLKNKILKRTHGLADPVRDITFERFLKEYFDPHTSNNYSDDSFDKAVIICKAALKMFKGRTMRSIKAIDIENFQTIRTNLKTMHGKQRKPATVLREMSIISRIFSLAVDNDVIPYNPYSRLKRTKFNNEQETVLERTDQQKFLDALPSQWVKDICIMVLHTGLRNKDIMNLTRFNVNRTTRMITLIQSKTQKKVEIACSNSVMEILERRWHSPNQLLFASPVTGTASGSVRHTMQRTCEKLGIPQISIRDLRRTFATRGIEDGHDVVTIASTLGHSSLRMVMRYVKSLDNKRKLAESVENPANIPQRPKLRKVK